MKLRNLIVPLLAFAAYAYAQTCILPAPAAPPVPPELIVYLPRDGGTQGCTASAPVPGGNGAPARYAVSNAKCATAVQIAKQAAAIDNGWNDGGAP